MKFELSVNAEKTKAKFEKMPPSVRSEMVSAARTLDKELVSYAQMLASGALVNIRTGAYVKSIKGRVSSSQKTVTGKVFSRAPEAHFIESGAKRKAMEILPKKAEALAFLVGGKTVFAKRVHHPGSVMQPRHLLEQALGDMENEIYTELGKALEIGLSKA